jgi:hypothetical protein
VDVSGTRTGHGGKSASPTGPRKPRTAATTAPRTCNPGEICRGTYSVGLLPHPTVQDLASFRPAAPTLSGEPVGIGLVGLPTNVIAGAATHDLHGTLLGYTVTVRFTPTAYRFDYGDGSTQTTSAGGQAWRRLGQPQFTPTATSHVYRSAGTYAVAVTTMYSPTVDFGAGNWMPVDGVVSATTGGYVIRAVEAHTALVAHTCVETPHAPGC